MFSPTRSPLPATSADSFALAAFLTAVDLTTSGVGDPMVRHWIDLNPDGRIVGSTGFELAGSDALLRSVAVAPQLRRAGRGRELTTFALNEAAGAGATRAWLVNSRSPAFARRLGFHPADIHQLAAALLGTTLVRALGESGILNYQSAWVREL